MGAKKLIEVALPLEAINKESAREKSIRHGHPSTLHLWWARRPLAAARAVIWSSLVDDPSSHPEQFPTEEAQNAERERLFRILEKLVVWENSNNPDVLDEAKAEIMKSTDGNPPALLDPFAGGGAIPLEAQRLGLEAHAHELNPVAVMINKAMIEIPPKFAGQPPIHPGKTELDSGTGWKGAAGLAEDVRYYGEWMKQEAFKRIGHLYPKVKDEKGKEYTVIAWIWARTVKCSNPACRCEMPLLKSVYLSKKAGNEAYIEISTKDGIPQFSVHKGRTKDYGTINRKGGICPFCNSVVSFKHIREEFNRGQSGSRLVAIVAEGNRGRMYFSPDEEQLKAAYVDRPQGMPIGNLAYYPGYINPVAYGFSEIASLFSNRQLIMLSTLSDLIAEVAKRCSSDATKAGMSSDEIPLAHDGKGAKAYGEAISVYLAFLQDKIADYHSTICSWNSVGEKLRGTFGMTGISMTWDYAETNPFSNSSGSLTNMHNLLTKAIMNIPANSTGFAKQYDVQTTPDCPYSYLISTDPPYYNNVPYADFADYFYVWMRTSIHEIYPELFSTMLTPKSEELTADPYFRGGKNEAAIYFENGMAKACKTINRLCNDDFPVTIYYAYKQSENTNLGKEIGTSSTGWETMLSAIIKSGFCITGTWPISTEKSGRTREISSNALASSIIIVCRKRPADAPMCTRRDFINALKRELKPALQKLQASNIAPVDLAQSAIGPGMGVYSRYSNVLEADGTPMSVRSALQIINQELDLYFNEQDGELDKESRFCVELYTQCAFNDIKFGEADVLARAKNTSVDKLRADGVLYSEKGVVHLLTREEIPMEVSKDKGIWLLTQQLTHAMETDGVDGAAKIVKEFFTSEPERAKALAYRLFTLAERRGWANEAFAYNSLIVAWPDVQSRAADLSAAWSNAEQTEIWTSGELFSGEG